MIKRFLSLLCVLALCLGLLPVTALAEGTAPQTLYVGSTTITVEQLGPIKRISRREITTYTTTAKAPWNCTMRPSREGLIPGQRLLAPGSMLCVAAINQLP